MPLDIKRLEELEQRARDMLDPASDDYDDMVGQLDKISNLIDTHYTSQRKTDDDGRLTEDAPGRYGASVEGTDPTATPDYFFEPNIREVQDFLRRTPGAVDRLGMRNLVEGIAVPEKREDVLDPMSGAPQGWNVVPAQTHLDVLTKDNPEYKTVAEEMWRLKSEDAKRLGKPLKRYRDIQLKDGEIGDYIHGGVTKGMQRVVAPALMGVADAATMGQAAPLGDALTDLADYELGRRGHNLEDYFGNQPRSREVINRSMPAYIAGQFAGYGLPRNPTNALQSAVGEAAAAKGLGGILKTPVGQTANYTARGVGGRFGSAAVGGGVSNAVEAGMGGLASAAAQESIKPGNYSSVEDVPAIDLDGRDIGNIAATAAEQVPAAAGIGAAGAGIFDLAGQGIGHARETFAGYGRNAPLRTLENAGGEASIPWGVKPPDEIRNAAEQVRKDRFSPSKAPGTAAGRMAAELAPTLEESVTRRATGEQERIAGEMQEYYNHPAYRDIEGSTKPAIQGLVDMAGAGFGRDASGSLAPVDTPKLRRIGSILREYAPDPQPVDDRVAWALAHQENGILVPAEVANHLFGDVLDPVPPGKSVLLKPITVNAQALTQMEERIYRELDVSNTRGMKDDPVWKAVNEGIKKTRDEFPLYRDENGKLVPPPPDSTTPQPFPVDPETVPPTEEMRVLNPPERITGGPQRKPDGLYAVGPGQPDLPSSPFDPRAGIKPGVAADQLPRPIGIGGDGMVARPEGLYAVGPEGNPIPDNPFDTRAARTSAESIRPMMQQIITGGETSVPQSLDPNARMGVGPRDNQGPVQSFTDEGLPIPGKSAPQQTVDVQGDYNKPPEIEPAPITERGMPPAKFRIMVMENGQPRPVAGMREANSAEEAANMADTLNSYGTDEFTVERIEPAPTPAIEPRKNQDISPEERNLQQHDIDDFLARDKEMNAPSDSRSPLERQLDDQLGSPDAPPVPKTDIEEAAARQTADREQVAQNQKAYIEDILAPGREARAAQVEKIRSLAENPEVIEEAIAAVKKVDERLGPIGEVEKRNMVIKMIETKLGRKIDAEDLIRFGLISAGLVQVADEDSSGEGSGLAAMGLFGFGKGKKGPEGPEGPSKPKKPTQPTAKLDDGREVKGFSAMRSQQHTRQEAIERAMKRLGVEGDTTLEGRIRTYGQLDDRGKIDQALLDEAKAAGKDPELRRAAGANAYAELRDRASPFGSLKGLGNALIDMFGFRLYAMAEYPAGRFDRENIRNPYVREPNTLLGDMQRKLVEDPARRLFDLTRGGPAARYGSEKIYETLKGDSRYESKEEREKREAKKRRASP